MMGAQAGIPDEIRAKSFVVVDAQGKKRAMLGLLADGTPGLALSDAQGKAHAMLGLFADGTPCLDLYDANGNALFSAP